MGRKDKDSKGGFHIVELVNHAVVVVFHLEVQMEGEDFSELRGLVERKDLSGFGKILYGTATAGAANERCPADLLAAADLVQSQWVATLAAGDTIDLCPAPFVAWYTARLLRKEEPEPGQELEQGRSVFLVHYMGWGKDKAEAVDLTKCCCLPAYTMTKQKKKSVPRRKTYFYLEPIEDPDSEGPSSPAAKDTDTDGLAPPEVISEEKTESVAPPHPSLEQQALVDEKREQQKEGKGRERKKKKRNLVDEADWICTECGDMEAPDDSDLLLCEGGCKRSFHLLCLGIVSPTDREKIIAGDAWVCDDCLRHRHTCAICHDEGDDNTVCFALSLP